MQTKQPQRVNTMIRLMPEVHEWLASAASEMGISLNLLVNIILAEYRILNPDLKLALK